jgi:hypothetical protein
MCNFRGGPGLPAPLPELEDRPAIKAGLKSKLEVKACDTNGAKNGGESESEPLGHNGLEECGSGVLGKRRRKHTNKKSYAPHERIHRSYVSGTWKARAEDIITKLEASGLGGLLEVAKSEKVLRNMQKRAPHSL